MRADLETHTVLADLELSVERRDNVSEDLMSRKTFRFPSSRYHLTQYIGSKATHQYAYHSLVSLPA